ncbi:MAG: hypothetical protein JRJ57_01315 [Deltaproteobacteria bacterium]|nr:hypothetical protein [Deltaproteobacteria bacterium]
MGSVTLEVLRPTGLEVAEEISLAPRLNVLDGKRIGLVWNHKDYGDRLLDEVEKLLNERYPTAELSRWQLKECCKRPPEGELEAIAAEVDAVIYSLGD